MESNDPAYLQPLQGVQAERPGCVLLYDTITIRLNEWEPEFVDMLNEMRFGRLTQGSISKFRSLSRAIQYEDGLDATELYAPNTRSSSQTLMAALTDFLGGKMSTVLIQRAFPGCKLKKSCTKPLMQGLL